MSQQHEPAPSGEELALTLQWLVNHYVKTRNPKDYAHAVASMLFEGGPTDDPDNTPCTGPVVVAALLNNARCLCEIAQAMTSLGRGLVMADLVPASAESQCFYDGLPATLAAAVRAHDGFTSDLPLVACGPDADPIEAFVQAVARKGRAS